MPVNTGQVLRPGPYGFGTSVDFLSSGLPPPVAIRLNSSEFLLTHSEVVCHFVADNFAYFGFHLGIGTADFLNRLLKDDYAVREYHPISVCALRLRNTFV